jgi:hypothetical protein
VNRRERRILQRCERKIQKRLAPRNWDDQLHPMFQARNIQYEMAERAHAIDCGGLGALHTLAHATGLVRRIDQRLRLLKRHLPYHESDHVLNVSYNVATGGHCLDDLERRRNDEAYLDALGAQRIPDPTTEGDFARRFKEGDVIGLMEVINEIQPRLWRKRLSSEERERALVDVDGTVAPTTGECKEGMGLSYNGVWGYHPLVVSLANTRELITLVNRPGNRPSHDGAAAWLDRAAALARQAFTRVCFRGDTDFSLTIHFDCWTDSGTEFAFGMDAMKALVKRAEALPEKQWKLLKRPAKPRHSGATRERPVNVKAQIVAANEYENLRLQCEHVAEIEYRPSKCKHTYRLIILRKNLTREKGERRLFDEVRYFFYITNRRDLTTEEVVHFCNDRANQENLIEQLKNGLNALRMPVGDLVSNWAYMVMASLAWTLKAWLALVVKDADRREKLLRMEFRRFLGCCASDNGVIRIPAQIVRTGRRVIYRLLAWNEWTATLMETHDAIRALRLD